MFKCILVLCFLGTFLILWWLFLWNVFVICFFFPGHGHCWSGIQKPPSIPPNLHHSSRYIPSFSRPHFFLACFWQMATYSRTSSVEPMATGARWWMLSGWMSRRGWRPVEAKPPACSTMKAMGLPSYSRRSLGGRGGGGRRKS